MTIDEILEKYNLKYNDLNVGERETLHSWMEALNEKKITLESVKEYITSMRGSVEQDLTKVGHDCKQDLFLKARLRNYMLLEAFLMTPERAKKALEEAMSGLRKG